MKALRTIAACVALASAVQAQDKAPGETMTHLFDSAQQELARGSAELAALRTTIDAEKLPMTRELSAQEEQLADLRKLHDTVTRAADAGNLEAPALKSEIKARQEEIAYVGNLLDEYVRNFETKAAVGELARYGAAVESAKEARENPALSSAEKFERQLAFATASIARLFEAIGGMRFPGVGVDLQGRVVDGQFALFGPIALFATGDGATAGLVVPQSGSTNPLIRPLEGPMQLGLASLVNAGDGILPLDPSLGGALRALVQKTNLFHIFEKGGPIMWPLLIASILALGTVFERLLFLMMERFRRDESALHQFFKAVSEGNVPGAIGIASMSKFFVVRSLGYALTHVESSLESALMYAQARELKRLRRGIPVLDTIITLSPLLGLLGTVTGMMGSFALIGGDLSAPGAITGGIAEALIATAFGLGIAITAVLPFNFLNAKIEESRHELESAARQLELLLRPSNERSTAQQRLAAVGAVPAFAGKE